MEAWSITRKRLAELLMKRVKDRFSGDPLVQVYPLSAGEFRVTVYHLDNRVKPRNFRVKVTEEKNDEPV